MPDLTPGSADLRSWLQFVFAPGLGALSAARLLAEFGGPRQAISASDAQLANFGLTRPRVNALRKLAQSNLSGPGPELKQLFKWGERDGQAILTPLHAEYPELLRAIPVPPPVLYRVGRPVPEAAGIAVVGARKATAAGSATARELAAQLARSGMVVVSGLARGIDAAAHQGALEAGGHTTAVLGCGPDIIYPRANARLYQAIIEQGTLLSEFPPGSSPRKHHFPQRNRLISGLALGTLVVEAGLRSGSLSTARHALEQGREVFAVPGSVHSPNSRGPHQLIRDGAQLVETVDDILCNLPEWAASETECRSAAGSAVGPAVPAVKAQPPLRPELRCVLDALDYHPLPVDELIARAGLPAATVNAALCELEVDGRARMEGCGYARRAGSD